MRDTAAALSHISNLADGRVHIFRSGGIAELVRMLRCPIDIVVHYAVTTLHNLLLYLESAKQDTIACGGLEALVPLLKARNPKLQALVADSIYFLLLDRPQCKMTFLSLQGPQLLVNILNSGTTYIKLIYAVVRCIRSISTCPQNKASLISIGKCC
jgi:junction plakoglobin